MAKWPDQMEEKEMFEGYDLRMIDLYPRSEGPSTDLTPPQRVTGEPPHPTGGSARAERLSLPRPQRTVWGRTLIVIALGILFLLLAVLEVMASPVSPHAGSPATRGIVLIRGVDDAPAWLAAMHALAGRVGEVETPD